MADLFKEAKRGKPLSRIADGYVYSGERYAELPSPSYVNGERQMPPMLLTLNVHSRQIGGTDAECYELRLTEAEALSTCAEWMKLIATRRTREDAKAREAAAIANGEHQTRDSPLRSRS